MTTATHQAAGAARAFRLRAIKLLAGICVGIGAAAAVSWAADDVDLRVSPGSTASEIRLDWTGGSPTYRVYRATDPRDVVTPATLVGETSGQIWIDAPPAGTILYYFVTANCPGSVELCNGLDDDCDGQVDEGCPASCSGDGDCRPEQHCDGSACVPDLADGGACSGDAWCAGGHCGNGYCCAAGDCCATAGDCAAHATAPVCVSAATCQGTRGDATCDSASGCATVPVDDDSACGPTTLSQSCGLYPDLYCTGAVSQPADQASLCPVSCAGDADCDAAAHCDTPTGSCVPDLGAGGFCTRGGECLDGLSCVDSVCCTSSCSGICTACDVVGTVGSCAPIPSGTDPDLECGRVSCSGYYWGWSGDTCYSKADVSAAQATCNGAGACRTQDQECTLQTVQGTAQITCNSQCQDPQAGTCTGTTPGSCVNVNPGNQTCGVGACQRTAPLCSNGVPATCVPGAPTTETCNDLDDDCDGVVDNGIPSDAAEPNNSCSAVRGLGVIGSDQTLTYQAFTLYPSGDVDTYLIQATETDSTCACCDFFCTTEDYRMNVWLAVPPAAGSYQLCVAANTCSFANCVTVAAGSAQSLSLLLQGSCFSNDAYPIYIRVAPLNAPGYECTPYTLSLFFDALVCN
jgi:Putative metal-binding motif